MNYLIFICFMIGIYMIPYFFETIRNTFSGEFDKVYTHLRFFKNFQSELQVQENTLLNSLKRRYLELSFDHSGVSPTTLKSSYDVETNARNSPHYQSQVSMLQENISRISKSYFYTERGSFRMLTVSNDHSRYHRETCNLSIAFLDIDCQCYRYITTSAE